MAAVRMPVLFLPHGGGPCFQLQDGAVGPRGLWAPMRRYLQSVSASLPAKPAALLVCVACCAKGPLHISCLRALAQRFAVMLRYCCTRSAARASLRTGVAATGKLARAAAREQRRRLPKASMAPRLPPTPTGPPAARPLRAPRRPQTQHGMRHRARSACRPAAARRVAFVH